MTRRFRFSWFVAVALSCGHPASAPLSPVPATAVTDACVLTSDSAAAPDTLRVAVPDVDRFVQRQVQETQTRTDCRGKPQPLRTEPMKADSSSGVVTLTPFVPGRPTVTVRASAGGDARDLLDHGIDILVSGDPEVLSYAASKSDVTTVPLPWDRVYVLLSSLPVTISDTARTVLARDVVRTDARPARGPYWWTAACPFVETSVVGPASGAAAAPVLYYSRDDAPARALAERLVALGLVGRSGRAAGVGDADFDVLLSTGGASFLVPLPREALAPCNALAALGARAPWFLIDSNRQVTALVETRRRAIVRRGGSAFTVDWDGTLRLR